MIVTIRRHSSPLETSFRAFLKLLVPKEHWSNPLLDINGTPERVARMWGSELLRGWAPGAKATLDAKFKWFPADASPQSMLTESSIPFSSTCAHHLLPFTGYAHFGYIPRKRVMGLSKAAWVVDHFAGQLQLQERLTSQAADYLWERLDPIALILLTDAEHECMSCRGPRKPGVVTSTAALRGDAFQPEVRQEFYSLIRR